MKKKFRWQCKTSISSWCSLLSQGCTETPICERATVYALPYVILVAASRPAIIEETDYTTIIRYALWLPVDATIGE